MNLSRHSFFRCFLGSLATMQFVWFYSIHVPNALSLAGYIDGAERMPFQGRLLIVFLLRHLGTSAFFLHLAAITNNFSVWLPRALTGVETLQAVIDFASVTLTGWVAKRLYALYSPSAILAPFIYPLTLLVLASTFLFQTTHLLRFPYDLASTALFSLGLLSILERRSSWFLLIVFTVATVNKETSLLLIPALLIERSFDGSSGKFQISRLWCLVNIGFAGFLSAMWTAWHFWLLWRFKSNPSVFGSHLVLNIGLLLCPIAWPQIASACAYLLPLVLLNRKAISDPVLRAFVLILPGAFMVQSYFGVLAEPRIFGEWVAFVSCTASLIAEDYILRHTSRLRLTENVASSYKSARYLSISQVDMRIPLYSGLPPT